MGDNLRQDEPGMKPDGGIRLRAKGDQPADADVEGHGGGKWAGAKDEAPDGPGLKPEGIKKFVGPEGVKKSVK